MKKTIKLSTNDLNNIIVESVKRVLNELDSKTYYNAADKASKLGQNERGYEFLFSPFFSKNFISHNYLSLL